MRPKMRSRESTPGSGNVFADLDLPQADDLLAKAGLAAKIIEEIQRRRFTQVQAASFLGWISQRFPRSSKGSCRGFR